MYTEEELLRAVENNPDDWLLYQVIADYYEENGRIKLARAFRWCRDNFRHPQRPWTLSWWLWHNDWAHETITYCLPKNVFSKMMRDKGNLYFLSFVYALEALANALD